MSLEAVQETETLVWVAPVVARPVGVVGGCVSASAVTVTVSATCPTSSLMSSEAQIKSYLEKYLTA